jgi:hypothetical protein
MALATRLAVSKLETLATAATRKGDASGAALVWKEVLSFDSTNRKGRLYFDKLGTLAAVMKEIGESQPTATTEPKPQSSGSGLQFNGDGWVVASSLKYDGRAPVTLEAVVTATDVGGSGSSVVGNIHNAGIGIMLQDGTWQLICHDGTTYRRARSDESAKVGEKVHIAGVYDGRAVTLYINGIRQKAIEQMSGPHRASPQPFMIGADPTGSGRAEHFLNGTIHSLRISNSARYTTNFAVPLAFGADKSTVALWKLDEGQGLVLKDSSGNGHHARINGSKWVGAAK